MSSWYNWIFDQISSKFKFQFAHRSVLMLRINCARDTGNHRVSDSSRARVYYQIVWTRSCSGANRLVTRSSNRNDRTLSLDSMYCIVSLGYYYCSLTSFSCRRWRFRQIFIRPSAQCIFYSHPQGSRLKCLHIGVDCVLLHVNYISSLGSDWLSLRSHWAVAIYVASDKPSETVSLFVV